MKDLRIKSARSKLQNVIVHNEAKGIDWTCCFTNSSGELVLGIHPNSDMESQRQTAVALIGDATPIHLIRQSFRRHANKQQHNRPVVGGIRIKLANVDAVGTVGIVYDYNNNPGVITAGHVVESIDTKVYQPRVSERNDWEIGQVTRISNYDNPDGSLSDSAFVQLNNNTAGTTNSIWKSANSRYTVVDFPVAQLSTQVFMQGATTARIERQGIICSVNATVRFEEGGILTDQYLANYISHSGDSGAPVYIKANQNNVGLIGINVGAATLEDISQGAPNPPAQFPPSLEGTYAVISKWNNILRDLF